MSNVAAAAERGTARIIGIIPQFLVSDLERSILYYRDKLGFTLDFIYEDFYASVSRDGFKLHLKHGSRTPEESAFRKANEHLDAYVGVTGIHDLFGELQQRGAEVTRPLEERPWNCTEFEVADPDGYILLFSELKE